MGLTFQGNVLSSLDTCTSVELGPLHLTNFHHLLNSAVGTVCMILVSFKAIPSCLPRRYRISFSCMFARIFLIYDAINLLQLRRFLWRLLILLLRLQLLFLLLLSFRLYSLFFVSVLQLALVHCHLRQRLVAAPFPLPLLLLLLARQGQPEAGVVGGSWVSNSSSRASSSVLRASREHTLALRFLAASIISVIDGDTA